MIFFMLFLIFTLIKFSISTPDDTLNLAVGCSPSYMYDLFRKMNEKNDGKTSSSPT